MDTHTHQPGITLRREIDTLVHIARHFQGHALPDQSVRSTIRYDTMCFYSYLTIYLYNLTFHLKLGYETGENPKKLQGAACRRENLKQNKT